MAGFPGYDANGDYIGPGTDDTVGSGTGLDGSGYNSPKNSSAYNDNSLSQSRYGFTYKAFPNDLGMDYMGHYMVININVPTELTSWEPATNLGKNFTELKPIELSKVDVLRFSKAGGASGGTQSDSFTGRRTRRIVESIALYMPGTQLIYNQMNAYEEVSMTALGGQLATGFIGNAATLATYFFGGLVGGALIDGVANVGDKAAGIAQGVMDTASTAMKLAGRPITPRIEVLFSLTSLRDFQFEFLLMPRNEEEAKTIQGIVQTLRFHSAPEIINKGFNFIPPAEFDITFYHNGVETDKVPRINTCVMTRFEVDYAPGTGVFSTFRDGQPVATRLMMCFKEVEVIHKLRVLQGF